MDIMKHYGDLLQKWNLHLIDTFAKMFFPDFINLSKHLNLHGEYIQINNQSLSIYEKFLRVIMMGPVKLPSFFLTKVNGVSIDEF